MLQYFKSFGLALLLSVGVGSVASTESDSPVLLDSFNRMSGGDLFGYGLTSMGIKGISQADCHAICSKDSSCKAYSFIEAKQWCFPKSGPDNKQENAIEISGIKVKYNFDCFNSFEKNEAEVAYCDFLNLKLNPENLLHGVGFLSIQKSLTKRVVGLGAYEGYDFFLIGNDEDRFRKDNSLLAVNCSEKSLYHLSNAAKFWDDDVPQLIKFKTYRALLALNCSDEGIEVADFRNYKTFCYSRVYYISNSLMQSCESAERMAYYDLLDDLFADMSVSSNYVSDIFIAAKKKWIAYSEAQCALDGVMIGTPAVFLCNAASAAQYYSETIDWLVTKGEYGSELKALNINYNNID